MEYAYWKPLSLSFIEDVGAASSSVKRVKMFWHHTPTKQFKTLDDSFPPPFHFFEWTECNGEHTLIMRWTYIKATFSFYKLIPKNTQMTTLYTNWSLHMTFTMIYYIRQE